LGRDEKGIFRLRGNELEKRRWGNIGRPGDEEVENGGNRKEGSSS